MNAQELLKAAKSIGKSDLRKNSALLAEQKLLQVGAGIPTKSMAMNIAMSGQTNGGIAPGVQIIAGPSRHFKSMYGLILCAAYLKAHPDAIMLFYDNEYGSSLDYFKSTGVDTDRVLHIPFTDLEELRSDLTQKLNSKSGLPADAKVIVLVDSLGNAASVKEIEDAENENQKADMTRAKTMKSLFRIITSKLRVRGIPFIGINHTYKTQEMYSKDVVGGGTGVMYSANDVWIVGKAQEKEGSDLVGYKFTINIEKSRRVKDKMKIPVVVKFDGGLSPVSGMFDIGKELGYIESPTAGWYTRKMHDKETGEIIEDSKARRADIEFNVEWFAELFAKSDFEQAIQAHYKLPAGKLIEDDDVEDESLEDLAEETDE